MDDAVGTSAEPETNRAAGLVGAFPDGALELLQALDQQALISIADRRGRIVYVSDGFCRISGYERGELLGQDHRMLNSGHHDRTFWANMWKTIAAGQTWRAEVCNRAKDGSLYWVDSTNIPQLGSDGVVERYLSLRFDITSRKRAESRFEDVASRNRRLAAAVNQTQDPTVIVGLDGEVKFENLAARQLRETHCGADEPGERSWLFRPERVDPATCQDLVDHACRLEVFKRRIPVAARPGAPLWLDVHASPLVNEAGALEVIVITERDITEQVRAETERLAASQAVEQLQSRFERAVEGSLEGVWEYQEGTDCIWISGRLAGLLGFQGVSRSGVEVPRSAWLERVHPEDREGVASIFDLAAGTEAVELDLRIEELSEGYRWFRLRCRSSSEDRAVSGSLQDVHAQRTVENRLAVAMRAANLGLWDVDVATGEVFLSDTFFTMLGYEPGAFPMTLEAWQSLLHPEDFGGFIAMWEASTWEGGEPKVSEHRLRRSDGSWAWVRSVGEAFEGYAGDGSLCILGVNIDIDHLKEVSFRLEMAQMAAQSGLWDWSLKT
ncbi:MAG: PAS domain-containing protein, partial [Myxococcota bacterium]